MKSTLSPHDRQKITARDAETLLVSAPADGDVLLWFRSRRGGGGGATFRPFCLGDTTMFIFGIILSIAAIGFFCWLLFTLAVFALPFFAGVTAGGWAYHTGAGWLGAILIGTVAAGLTLGFGQVLLATVRPLWAKFAIAAIFVAPAVIAGYHAVHGIVKHTIPSETWQIVFSVLGSIAVGITAFLRIAGMAAPDPANQGLARG
jgi:hypothetical protein